MRGVDAASGTPLSKVRRLREQVGDCRKCVLSRGMALSPVCAKLAAIMFEIVCENSALSRQQ